jgi:cytochrome c oxidase subunit 1
VNGAAIGNAPAPAVTRRDAPIRPEADERARLERAWSAHGALRWLRDVDHKHIGRRYIVTAFVYFAFGGAAALLMRLQLMRPESHLVGPDLYDQLFTMHGTSMMFLFAVPIMGGMGIYLVPLMVGTRNVAFPRLNALGYYLFLIAGIMLWGSFLVGMGPDAGWFGYVPLSTAFSAGKRVDLWAQLISLTEIASLIVAVEIIVTVFKQRAPGMTLDRVPLFVWAQLVTQFMVIFAMPAVMLGTTFIALDRLVGTQLFNYTEGGDALLWQHLFWFFGHPEVYIIFIPALGIVSSIITTFTQRPMFGYMALVLALVSTGFIGFGLWAHHMFATGLPQLGLTYFTAASMIIAIPSGIQIFCWIASLWRGRPTFPTPMLFVLGFVAIFVLGGLSGVTLASVPFDLQVHDTYYVVAHFHYVLLGGAVFPLIGGIYYWFPKMTGRMMDDSRGKLNFWLLFLGFNITFFPMHILGFQGMPRRVYTYPAEMGWATLNMVASLGTVLLAIGGLVFLYNVTKSYVAGAVATDNPWNADSLEWATSSPPPVYNFLHIPVVEGRNALWDRTADAPVIVGVRSDCREILVTDVMDAEPSNTCSYPEPSIWPFLCAVVTSAFFVGSIFTPWALPVAIVPLAITLIGWFWPASDGSDVHRLDASEEKAA